MLQEVPGAFVVITMILKKLWMILGLYCIRCKRWHTARIPNDSQKIFCRCGANWNVGKRVWADGIDFKEKLQVVKRKVLHVYNNNQKISNRN